MSIESEPFTQRLATPSSEARRYLSVWPWMARRASNLVIAAVLFFLVLPTLLVIPLALSDASYITFPPQGLTLRWFEAYLSDPDWLRSTIFSLQIAALTTVVATIIGTMAAVALVRGKLPGKALLQALCLGPMIVPAIVFGVALYLVFSPLQLTGNLTGFVLAHSVLAVPFVVIIVSAALERMDPLLELAALSCGAGRLRAFFAVTLPNLAPAVATAAVFAFLTSFDEATVAFFISDTGGKTISRKMFEDIDFNLTPVIAAVSVIVVAVSLLLMGSIHLLNSRRSNTSGKNARGRRDNKRATLMTIRAAIRLSGIAMLCAAILLGKAPNPAFASEQVVIATTGGAYDAALRKWWFEPFTAKTGIQVVSVAATNAEMRAKATAMVKTGNVSWDLYPDGEIQVSSKDHLAISEPLDSFCTQFKDRQDLVPDACIPAGVRLFSTATLMAYDPQAFKGNQPVTWADMWDTSKFPGGRAFPNFDDPWRVMAAALLADGVKRENLFPLDVDRALKKLDALRPSISLWWKTGDQSVQGFRENDYSIGQVWLTRASALKAEGRSIAWSNKAAFLVGDRLTVIKGAPNRNNALRLIAFWLDSPEIQAKVCEALLCTPPSSVAITLMPRGVRDQMPSAEDVRDSIVIPDAKWINDHASELLERWNNWVR